MRNTYTHWTTLSSVCQNTLTGVHKTHTQYTVQKKDTLGYSLNMWTPKHVRRCHRNAHLPLWEPISFSVSQGEQRIMIRRSLQSPSSSFVERQMQMDWRAGRKEDRVRGHTTGVEKEKRQASLFRLCFPALCQACLSSLRLMNGLSVWFMSGYDKIGRHLVGNREIMQRCVQCVSLYLN